MRSIPSVLAVALIASLYLPMLGARFDFADDGNLVYPAPPMPLAERVELAWTKVRANYDHLGPFRPALWAQWELQAEALRASEIGWRAFRLGWTMLATAALLWWLRELRIAPVAAVATTALALWSPAPGEIWRSLTLSEGVAMPYAIGALICAVRAGRSRGRAGAWDLAGGACALVALGCKNTFAAIVPAQILLRIAPDGEPLRDAIGARGQRASLLALPLLLPAVHYVVFLRGWHPGQYEPGAPSWEQLGRMLQTVKAGASLDLVAPAIVVAVLLGVRSARMPEPSAARIPGDGARRIGSFAVLASLARTVWRRHRAACRAGMALLVCGVGIYLPMPATAGRYAIPAVWGALLFIGVLLSEVLALREPRAVRIVFVLFAAGLALAAAQNLLRQDEAIARSALLWDAVESVERHAPPGTTIAWQVGPGLAIGEGIHFLWHLHARGRHDLAMQLLDDRGQGQERPEIAPATSAPTLLVSGPAPPDSRPPWTLAQELSRSYRGGLRRHACLLWRPTP